MTDSTNSNRTLSLKMALINLRIIGGFKTKRTILGYVSMTSMFFANAFMVMDIALNFTGIESLRRIAFLPSYFVSSFKGAFLLFYPKHVVDIVNNLRCFWRANKFDEKTETEIKMFFRRITLVMGSYSFSGCAICAMMAITPVLNFEERTLVYNNFALCNLKNLPCWIPMYTWQLLATTFQVLPSALSFDCLFVSLIGYIMTACKLLKIGLKQLNTENVRARRYYLKEIIKQHDFMMQFLNSMNNMFTVVMLLQFWCSLWSMILFLNMIVANGYNMADVIYFGILYVIILFQIFMYATGGALVEERVKSVAADIFMVNWYDENRTDLRKDLTLMIFRAQRTKILHVGKMSHLNYPLFLATVKNSLSVVTLIWQVANKDSE